MLRPGRPAERSGFTLIEVLAVAALLALIAGFIAPNLGGVRARALRAEALQIADHLELARQRAILTGVPHRLWMELDEAEYRLEWLAADAEPSPEPEEIDLRGPLSLEAPRTFQRSYQPVPGNFGRLQVVADPFFFDGLETPDGWIGRGESQVVFERDGSASYTEIYLQDEAGHRIALDVYPLDERVRLRDDL